MLFYMYMLAGLTFVQLQKSFIESSDFINQIAQLEIERSFGKKLLDEDILATIQPETDAQH